MKLRPIETAPTDGTYLLLFGDSGYTTTPLRCEVGCWCREKLRWNDHAGDAFTDGGDPPTHWCPLPGLPEAEGQPKSLERPHCRVFQTTDGRAGGAMSDEQQQETPVWHAIVGEGWEPVLIGEMAKPDEEKLFASGWINARDSGGFVYCPGNRPRRRRKASYEISIRKSGTQYSYLKAAWPGDCFMVADNGELIPVAKPQAEGQVQS